MHSLSHPSVVGVPTRTLSGIHSVQSSSSTSGTCSGFVNGVNKGEGKILFPGTSVQNGSDSVQSSDTPGAPRRVDNMGAECLRSRGTNSSALVMGDTIGRACASDEKMGWLTVAELDLRLGLRDAAVSKFTSAWIWTRFVPSDAFDFDREPSSRMLFVRRTCALSAASITPMLVGRFSSPGRLFSGFGGGACGNLAESDLVDLVGDAGGLGRTARTPLIQLSRDGNLKPPGGEGGNAVAGFVDAPAIVGRGGDGIVECDAIFIDSLCRRGGRGGTGGTADGMAGRGPVGGGRGSGGGVIDRDKARLRCLGEKPVGAVSTSEDARFGNAAEVRRLGGVDGGTRCDEAPGLDGRIGEDVGDGCCATGDTGGDASDVQTETEDSVSEGACGATPAFCDGTTSKRRCGRPLCASNDSFRMSILESATCGPNDTARGVGSSSKLPRSLFTIDNEPAVPSKDDRVWFDVGSAMLRLLLVATPLPKIACNEAASA